MVKTNLYRKIQTKDDALEFVKELAKNVEFDKNADNEEGHRIIKLLNDCAVFGVKPMSDEKKVLTPEGTNSENLLWLQLYDLALEFKKTGDVHNIHTKAISLIREYGEQQRKEGYNEGWKSGFDSGNELGYDRGYDARAQEDME